MMRTFVLMFTTLFSFSLFGAGHDLTTSPPSAYQLQPVVTGNSSGFTAAWMESELSRHTLVSARVNAEGEPIEGGAAAIDQLYVQSVAIAHSPSDTIIAWIADGNVFAKRQSASGLSIDTIALTSGKGVASDVAVAWNGTRYFVIWTNGSQLLGGSQLVGAFIAADGSSTPPRAFFDEPFFSQLPPSKEFAVTPDIAWDGQHFVVVFGERPNFVCSVLCPVPNPDQFRVMRVSADGDAIDGSPLVIAGSHLRAHVASSGAESLIVFDGFRDVSTIIAHTDGGLTLDAETPMFRWFVDVSSAVVWDGAAYTVGWRYVGNVAGPSWLGAAHVTRSGLPFDYRVTATGSALPYGGTVSLGRPSIAVNDAGITALAISESAGPASVTRARLYFASELAPMPAPPSAPRNVVSYFGGNMARIDWQSDDAAAGFAIEAWSTFDNTWYVYTTAPGNARTINIYTSIGSLFRIRALGPGGVSEGTITSIGSMQRRRAERR